MRASMQRASKAEPNPYRCVVYDANGEAISRRYIITAADEDAEVLPGGEPGAFRAWVDREGHLLENKDHDRADHVRVFPCPGLRIEVTP